MLCALSGKDVVEPVVSPVSGKIYERNLIEKWISERGTDPATNTPLSAQQLVKLDLVPANPQITTTTSIPALLEGLQAEFNALALDNFDLRQQNEQQRAELNDTSYKIEAALRVITRLTQERDELRHALEELNVDAGKTSLHTQDPQNHHPQSALGQGHAVLQLDNNTNGDASQNSKSLQPVQVSQHDEAQMDVEDQVDVANDESHIPNPPKVERGSTVWQDILGARKVLTAERRQFNAEIANLTFADPIPQILPNISGQKLKIYMNWAIITSNGQDVLFNLHTNNVVDIEWDHAIRHLSFLEAKEPQLALLSTRRLAIWDLATSTVTKTLAVQGNPLEAIRHPAGPLMVRFTGRIETYDADTFEIKKASSLSIPKLLAFAVHPDGEFIIYYAGVPSRSKTLVFYSLVKRAEVLTVETEGPVSSITASVNGYHVAYFDGQALAILDLRNDNPPVKHELPNNTTPSQLSFDSTGRRLYVSTANIVFEYLPQGGKWIQQSVHSDIEQPIVAWSDQKTQVPITISSNSE